MATYIFHSLMMVKVKIAIFFCLNGDRYLEFIFTEMFIELSSKFYMAFVQIAKFDR